jgi:hypothetical protein
MRFILTPAGLEFTAQIISADDRRAANTTSPNGTPELSWRGDGGVGHGYRTDTRSHFSGRLRRIAQNEWLEVQVQRLIAERVLEVMFEPKEDRRG